MEAIRQQLKLCARQCDLYNKSIVMLTNNLISLSDKTFPGVNELFSSPEKADGHLKWVDFYRTFWHCDCINRMSPDTFGERYQNGARERATILVLMQQMLSTQPAAGFTPRCRVTTMPGYWLRLPPTSLLHCAKTVQTGSRDAEFLQAVTRVRDCYGHVRRWKVYRTASHG